MRSKIIKGLMMFCCSGVLQSCHNGIESSAVNSNESLIKIQGVIDDHYSKLYSYVVRGEDCVFLLDAVVVPDSKIGQKVYIEGRLTDTKVGEVYVITEVIVDGVRLETKMEWYDSQKDAEDPFQ